MSQSTLPTLNASLNAIATLLLLAGFVAIKQGRRTLHIRLMLSATGVSAIFLTSYLYYHANFGSVAFEGQGVARTIYFAILITHIPLAATVPFLALTLIYLGWRQSWERHKKLAKIAWPIWMYVSITGVLIYLMLYQWFVPDLTG